MKLVRALYLVLWTMLFPAHVFAGPSETEDLPELLDSNGASSNFTDYLNAEPLKDKDRGLVLYEDPDGTLFHVGGEDNEGAAFRIPIE